MPTLVAAKNCMDWHCPIPVQLGVAGFIADGHLSRHVRKMRQTYKQRRQRLLNGLQEELGEWLDPIPSYYGMHIAAVARAPLDLDRLAETLRQQNVQVHALSRYHLGPQTWDGLVFGYGAVDLDEIDQGVELLRAALLG